TAASTSSGRRVSSIPNRVKSSLIGLISISEYGIVFPSGDFRVISILLSTSLVAERPSQEAQAAPAFLPSFSQRSELVSKTLFTTEIVNGHRPYHQAWIFGIY